MSGPLSIAFLSHLASPRSPTGAEQSLALLAEGMKRRGHRVAVVAPGKWTLARRLREAGIEVHVRPCRVCWMVYHDPVPFWKAGLKWLLFMLPGTGMGSTRKLLAGWRPDVVHVNCLPHLRGASAAKRAGLPVVWHIREILPEGHRRRCFAARLNRYATEVVAVSEAVGEWIRAENAVADVTVIPNGVMPPDRLPAVERARAELGLPPDGCVAGLFGQILPHKGVLEFVRAGRLALRDAPGLRFVIAGAGPDSFVRRVRAEIGSGEGAPRFHLLPPRRSADLLMAASDVVCLTTRTPDPLPRVVLEAMAAGRPVAAFRSGGTAEMIEDERTGLLVDVGDVSGLSAALARLAGDPDLRRSLGEAGAVRARESFSMDLHLDRMEAVFRRVARR